MVTTRLITQSVIPRGIQIRSPVMKYFFTGRGQSLLAGRTGARAAGWGRGLVAGGPDLSPDDPGRFARRLGLRPVRIARPRMSPSVAEVSLPPDFASSFLAAPSFLPAPLFLKSVTYQPEPFSWKPAADTSLPISALPQLGAIGDRCIAQLLEILFLKSAAAAAVFVDRHLYLVNSQTKTVRLYRHPACFPDMGDAAQIQEAAA